MLTLRPLAWLLLTIALPCVSPSKAQEFVMPDTKARELAYFGDVHALRLLAGPVKNIPALEKNTQAQADALFQEAVMGEAWDTISLLVDYGWPAPYPNLESWSYFLTPKAVRELAKRVPSFQHVMGDGLLLYTLRQGNLKLVQSLKDAGVKIQGADRALAAATARRNFPMVKWLLDQGTDPFQPAGENAIDTARKLKSADLLTLLDRRGNLATEVEQLRKKFAPSERNSALAGTWARRKDGFGSLVIVLYPDGTALMAGDLGAFPMLWNADDHVVRLIPAMPSPSDRDVSLELGREADELVLAAPKTGERIALRREAEINPESNEAVQRQRPLHLRIQTCAVDNEDILWLGINGRHGRVSLSKLVEGGKRGNYGTDANSENILEWEDFVAGPVPKDVMSHATLVAVDDRTASPGYSPQWSDLYLDHDRPAPLTAGSAFTLFRGIPDPSPLQLEPAGPAEYPHAFALLAEKPFSHGKRWVLIFLRKGRLEHSGP